MKFAKNNPLGFLFYVCFIFILASPLTPKLKFSSDFFIYLYEFFLIPVFLLFIIFNIKFILRFKFLLFFLMTFTILLFSNFVNLTNYSSFFHIIKGIIYTPVFFLGYLFFSKKNIKLMLYISIVSFIINDTIYFIHGFLYGYSIWDFAGLSSGFSNKYFDVFNMSFGMINAGAHAIWGGYCILIFMLSLFLYKQKWIKHSVFYISSLLALVSLFLTVSRESLIVFIIACIPYLFIAINFPSFKFNKKSFAIFVTIFLCVTFVASLYYKHFPLVEKLTYMVNSYINHGHESNITSRVHVHDIVLNAIYLYPLHFITGYGFGVSAIKDVLASSAHAIGIDCYPGVVESAYLQFLIYGGYFSLLFFVAFTISVLRHIMLRANNSLCFMLLFITLANILAAIFTGATWIADFYCAQYFIILGMAFRYADEISSKNMYKNTLY